MKTGHSISRFPLFAAVATALLGAALPLHAGPTGANVVAGNVTVTQAGAATQLLQGSRNAIVNWQSFNIGAGESVNVLQPDAQAAMLARVVGGDASQLLGTLQANGRMFLINPKGIVIGRDALIDTAAFVASTLDVADADFLAGRDLTFKGDSAAGVVNLGKITAAEGNVALIAHTVKNEGAIDAPKGAAVLAAGTEVYLAAPDEPSVVVRANLAATAEKTGVENTGVIAAAQAQLEAAGGSIYELAINQSGVVRATGVERRNGRVLLTAGGGNVGIAGTVTAHNADGSGGEILVGGDYRGGNTAVANAANTFVTATAVLDAGATATAADGGRVIVWADHKTRFDGALAVNAGATGNGGFAEVSGKETLQFTGTANLTAPGGQAGSLLLDPRKITVVAGVTNPLPAGLSDSNWASAEDAGDQTLGADSLAALLAAGNVTLEATAALPDDGVNIAINSPVAWNSTNTLTLRVASDIKINSPITAPNATLDLQLGKSARITQQTQDGGPIDIFSRAESIATITVAKLRVGSNGATSAPAGFTFDTNAEIGGISFNGFLITPLLEIALSANPIGVGIYSGGVQAIRTTGTGAISYFYVDNASGPLNLMLNTTNATAGVITAITPDLLTLEAGSSINFANQADVVFVSETNGFVNQAGASVFGDKARFVIYTNAPGQTDKGGLTGDTPDIYSRAYNWMDLAYENPPDPAGDFRNDTLDRFVFKVAAGLPFLTYTADDKNRNYGSLNPTFTATVTGLQNGDLLANVVTGAPTFSTLATQSSGVGGYTITVGRGTLASATYDFAFEPGTLTITAAPLTITANNATRTFNTANPTFGVEYAGFVLGQDASVVSGLQVTTPATQSSTVGNYAITPSGATAPNYAITFVPGTLSITNTAPLSITANSTSRLYGAANPSFTASYDGFVGGDTEAIVSGLQFSVAATMSSGVGTYAITPFGATAPGYVISYFGGLLTINPAPLTISAAPVSRFYGDANPTSFTPTFTGLVAGDTEAVVTGLTLGTTATQSSNVGSYPITVSGGTAANYAITRTPGSLSVTPATLTVRADDATRRYGDPDPVFTYTTTGLRNGDRLEDVAFISTGPVSLADTEAGIGAYGIFMSGFGVSSNYNVSVQSGSLTITQRPLVISSDTVTKIYGDVNPEFTATFTGLASFDTPADIPGVTFSTLATQTSGVSNWGILVNSGLNQNYSISYSFGQLQILPAPLNITGGFLPALSRLYGRANPDAALPGVTGLVNGDSVNSLGLAYVFPALTSGAGEYTYTLRNVNPNYTFGDLTGIFRVDRAPLDVQLGGGGRLYGDANATSYGTRAQGVLTAFGDSLDSVLKVINPTDASFPPGTYQLIAELLSPNYELRNVTEGSYVIRPRVLTVDIASIARYYGDPTPDFSWTVGGDGLASFDNITAVMNGVKPAVDVGLTTNVGLYRLDPVRQDNPGYVVSWWPGYLAILPRPVEITVRNGISFGHDNVPSNFNATTMGVDLIRFNEVPSGQGYSATVTNLPSFMTQADYFQAGYFELRPTNDPMPVRTALNPATYVFPTRPVAPVTPTTPASSTPASTATVTLPPETTPETAPSITGTSFVILTDFTLAPTGNFIINGLNPPKDTTADRFPDVIEFIVPRGFGSNNFVVTKITNGVMTMKADPAVVERVREIEATNAKRKADRDAFYMTGTTTSMGEIVVRNNVAFGLPRDAIQSIREAVGFALNQEFINGDGAKEGTLAYAINGGAAYNGWADMNEDKIMAWLADLHTNPAKQALLAPAMMAHTMNVAAKDPSQRTEQENKLIAYVMPALDGARDTFIENARDARENWYATEGAARGTTLMGLFDGKVPYDKIIGDAVADTMGKAMTSFDEKVAAANKAGINAGAGIAGGAGAAIATGATLASTKVFNAVFPFAKIAIEKAGTSIGAAAGSAAAGPAAVIGIAVTILITEATAVADNEEARVNFEKMLNSGNDPINPNELMKSDRGKAIMMLGMANLFFGGK